MDKRLYRSRKKKVVAGIAGGLGDYLDIDPVIIRIIFVLITIFHGVGLLVYIIMWIVIPEEAYQASFTEEKNNSSNTDIAAEKMHANEQQTSSTEVKKEAHSSNGRVIVGAILIIIGLVFLSEKFFPFLDFEFVFAVGLIGLGTALLFNFFNKSEKKK